MVNKESRIRSKKLREQQYMEKYAKCLESKRVDWEVGGNVEEMWGASETSNG